MVVYDVSIVDLMVSWFERFLVITGLLLVSCCLNKVIGKEFIEKN